VSFRLTLTSEAEQSIEDQLLWYEEDDFRGGNQLADRWLAKLKAALREIADAPWQFGFAPENGRWSTHLELRQFRFEPWKTRSAWRILYIFDEGEKTVSVIQIRHAHRPFLHEEEPG
jgi:plasmid stabilization system protein ParE